MVMLNRGHCVFITERCPSVRLCVTHHVIGYVVALQNKSVHYELRKESASLKTYVCSSVHPLKKLLVNDTLKHNNLTFVRIGVREKQNLPIFEWMLPKNAIT